MYLVGAPHPNKDRAAAIISRLLSDGEQFVTDVEVYQEIIHRYGAIRRIVAISDVFGILDEIADEVLTFGMPEVRIAKELVETTSNISARDALHIAVMRSAGVSRILSFDEGFDRFSDIERLS